MARSNIFRISRRRKYYTDSERLDYKILQTTQSIEHLKRVIRSESHIASLKTKNKSYQDLKKLNYQLASLQKKKNKQEPRKYSSKKFKFKTGGKKYRSLIYKFNTLNKSGLEHDNTTAINETEPLTPSHVTVIPESTARHREQIAKEKFEKSVKNYPKGGKTRRDPFATQKDPTEDFDVNDIYKYR